MTGAGQGGPRRSARRRRLAAVVAAGVALGVATPATATPATATPATATASSAVAVAEVYPVPAGGQWAATGKGFGHGLGMSQWGSQGAARQGRTGLQILAFYYPGTAHATIAAAPIRVLISADRGADTVVDPARGLGVRDVASNALYRLPAGPLRWRAVADAGGMHVDRRGSAGWSRWTAPDGRSTWTGPLRFGVGETTVLTLRVGTTPVGYRGKLTAVRAGTTTLATVNTLPLDGYLWSVVPAESPPSWLGAALRSQAVAARTFAAYQRDRHSADRWDICDTSACQVYRGRSSEAASTTAAVRATPNQIRTYGGRPILAQYSASNGGWTVAGPVPYQTAKADPYDAAGGANPSSRWDALAARGRPAGPVPADRPGPGAARPVPGRARPVGRPDHQHGRRRQRRQRPAERRQRPARPEVDLVDPAADGHRPGAGAGRVGGLAGGHRPGRRRGRGLVPAARRRQLRQAPGPGRRRGRAVAHRLRRRRRLPVLRGIVRAGEHQPAHPGPALIVPAVAGALGDRLLARAGGGRPRIRPTSIRSPAE